MDDYRSTIQISYLNRTRASWFMDQQTDGTFILRSNAPGMQNWIVSRMTTGSTRTCTGSGNINLRAYPPGSAGATSPVKLQLVDPLYLISCA